MEDKKGFDITLRFCGHFVVWFFFLLNLWYRWYNLSTGLVESCRCFLGKKKYYSGEVINVK